MDLWITVGETLRPKFVGTIHIVCEAVVADRGHFEFDFGNTEQGYTKAGGGAFSPPSRPRPSGRNICPSGELAVGFEGRAGLFVDALALICAPSPTKLLFNSPPSQLGTVTTLQRPGEPKRPVRSADPNQVGLSIRSVPIFISPASAPAPGQTYVQRQLLLRIAAPRTGATPGTEFEFTWLDTPSHLPRYVNLVSYDTTKVLQGMILPDGITRGQPGRREVRARTSGSAPPGPWSLPIPFQLTLAQSTQSQTLSSPMRKGRQTTQEGLGAGTTIFRSQTTPQQGIGTGPTLIRPRGVGEKGDGQSDEMEKKP